MSKTEKSPVIIIRDTLRREIEKHTDGAVTVLYDDRDIPSYMLRIPRFTLETVDSGLGKGTHPAFLVGDKEVDEIFVGLVPAALIGGLAYSLPGEDRVCRITFDQARESCVKKGEGLFSLAVCKHQKRHGALHFFLLETLYISILIQNS